MAELVIDDQDEVLSLVFQYCACCPAAAHTSLASLQSGWAKTWPHQVSALKPGETADGVSAEEMRQPYQAPKRAGQDTPRRGR
jgi:hypothetical protein